jgi:hypothetical protein
MGDNVWNEVVNNSQITGGDENAVLSTYRYYSKLLIN